MISSSGLTTFAFEVDKLGGLKKLARTPYMRNLWAILKEFSVLPTNEDFRALTDAQINLMIHSMNEDHRLMELARKGISPESEHYDSDFEEDVWNREVGDWEVLREGHDPDEIARQVEKLTKEEDARNLAMKFDSLEDYNKFLEEGGKTTKETEVEQHMNRQLEAAYEKARRLEALGGKKLVDDQDRPEAQSPLSDRMSELDKEAMDKSIELFNSMDDDDFDVL